MLIPIWDGDWTSQPVAATIIVSDWSACVHLSTRYCIFYEYYAKGTKNSSTEVPARIWKCQCLTCGCHWALSTLSSWTHCCPQPSWWLLLLYIDRFGQSLPTIWSLQHISPFICHQIRPPKNSTHHRARRSPHNMYSFYSTLGFPEQGSPMLNRWNVCVHRCACVCLFVYARWCIIKGGTMNNDIFWLQKSFFVVKS